MKLNFILNGEDTTVEVAENTRLVDLLRNEFHLTGTKEGCGVGECGACTVVLDGKAVASCLVLAVSVEGKSVLTIEGLSQNGQLDPIQEAFIDHHAAQCGFCTPGFIMSAKALLDANPSPTREEIRTAISGNICRCTGYHQIVDAIEDAAERYRKRREGKA
ncbi:MAG: (2Fe-2S)-binding protein [Oscillospiraceae bacterium]|nr:(2Fe-2S)-binding protein [Oscillospiraceae bacterium]